LDRDASAEETEIRIGVIDAVLTVPPAAQVSQPVVPANAGTHTP